VNNRFVTPGGLISLFLLGSSLSLFGCMPPPSGQLPSKSSASFSAESGKTIIEVEAKQQSPFKTVMQDGVEMIEARGALGQFGGTFFETQIGDGPKTFNLLASTDATSSQLGGMLLSGLVSTDAYSGEVYPLLAKSVEVGTDQLTYTVTLRKGLLWSDGKPLTADDVVFTWNQIIKPGLGNASYRDTVMVDNQFPAVTKINDSVIVFKTAKPFVPFLRNLNSPIYPRHIVSSVVAKGNAAFSAFWNVRDADKHPEQFVSNSAWLLERYIPREQVIFKRNPRFFMVDKKGQRLPYLDRYSIQFVGDSNNQELQFEQGKSDIYPVPGNFVSRLRQLSKPDFKLYNQGPTTGTSFLAFNLTTRNNPQGKRFVPAVQSSWFNDIHFRQAINHAIRRQDIVTNILKGVGAPLFTAESLSSVFLNQSLAKGFDADLEQSRNLLKQSGFTWDEQGKLHDPKGHPVEFTLLTNSGNTEREAVGVNIKQDLAELGMTVNFKPIDFNVLVGKLNEGDWETMIMGLTGSNLEPHSGVNVWRSNGSLHLFNQRTLTEKTGAQNLLPWESEIDNLLETGAQTFDVQKRRTIYNQLQQVIYDQVPLIYLYSPVKVVAIKSSIQNFDPTPLETLHNLEEIWIQHSESRPSSPH
jgi:peptide/nickel transport system substrate-binding protein